MPIPLLPILSLFLNKKTLTTIIGNWKLMLIGMMSFIIGYQNLFETRYLFGAETIPSLEKRLKEAEDVIDICKDGNDKLSASIDRRNAEITSLKEASDVLKKEIGQLEMSLAAKRTETVKKVKTIIETEKTPVDCKASIEYLRDARKELKWTE